MAEETFQTYVAQPEEKIGLAKAALLFAREEIPELDVSKYLAMIDGFTRSARRAVGAAANEREAVERLLTHFIRDLQFSGNREDYYNVKNSYLNHVLDTRNGIPVTLSIVFIELGRPLGLPAFGVSFPSHFLVKVPTPTSDIIVDPFNGRVIGRPECEALVREHFGEKLKFSEQMLDVVGPREILVRLINNVKHLHANGKEFLKSLRMALLIDALRKDLPDNVRDMGNIYAALGRLDDAARCYRKYLDLSPGAPDVQTVRQAMARVLANISRLN